MQFFPATRPSILIEAISNDPARRDRAFDVLVSAYWRPVYKHVRLKWKVSAEDASDLVQGFFTGLFERGTLAKYDATAGKFHGWLRKCLDNYVTNEFVAAAREKRGGGIVFESLDYPAVEAELQGEGPVDAEALFYQEWVRSFFGLALTRLEGDCIAAGKKRQFVMWQRYEVAGDGESYATLAHHYGLPVVTITNELAALRRRFRKVLLETLREITADEREFRNEARSLLGVEV
jgi:RNA polymerase sigma factor (sigma-70 family)